MSDNVGAIFVQARPGVAEQVERYWRGRGAKPDGKDPLQLKPLSIREGRSQQLGIAVAPAKDGWIGIRDSERYFADYSLAKHLSKALKTRVVWFIRYGATDGAILRTFDKGKERSEEEVDAALRRLKLPDPSLYFEHLRKNKLPRWTLLSLSPVTAATYDSGPEPKEEEAGPPPDPKLATYFQKLSKGLLLTDADWEKIEELDGKFDPQVCRLGHRVLAGKESRSWVFSYLAGKAVKCRDLVLYRALLDRSPATKEDPINQSSLLSRLGLWLSYQLFKGPIPAEWHASVQTWIKAALPFASRLPEIHVAVAEAYARMGVDEKARDHVRLAIRNGVFYGHGLDKDPVVASLLKKRPFADEVAALIAKSP